MLCDRFLLNSVSYPIGYFVLFKFNNYFIPALPYIIDSVAVIPMERQTA